MDRRVDVEALRTGLDEVLAAAQHETRVVIQRDGMDAFVLTKVGAAASRPAQEPHIFDRIWADVEARALPALSMDEIDEEIEATRREVREANASRP